MLFFFPFVKTNQFCRVVYLCCGGVVGESEVDDYVGLLGCTSLVAVKEWCLLVDLELITV